MIALPPAIAGAGVSVERTLQEIARVACSAIGLSDTRTLDLALRLGGMHEYADTGRPITAAFAGAPTNAFSVYGATPQRDAATIGFSASTAIAQATSIYLRYDGGIGSGNTVRTLKGVTQPVYDLPLRDIEQEGLVGIEIPQLVHKIIIGPTQYMAATRSALWYLLEEAGVSNPGERIVASGVPLRT
jgi:hypothetical protein